MLPVILTAAGLGLAARLISDYLASEIQDSESEKRAAVRRRAFRKLLDAEWSSRGHMLDMLSAAQAEAWAEIDLQKAHRKKLFEQMDFARASRRACQAFETKNAGTSYLLALREAVTESDVRQHYWHCLVQKYKRKKRDLTSDDIRVSKRLGQKYFERPSFDEFLEALPAAGRLVPARMIGVKRDGYTLGFKDGFKGVVPKARYRESGAQWRTGRSSSFFVHSVNYADQRVEVDPGRTVMLTQAVEKGFDKATFEGPSSPVTKDGRVVGYRLVAHGVEVFLPARRATSEVGVNKVTPFRLDPDRFDPFSLVAVLP